MFITGTGGDLFAKGTCLVEVRNIANGDLMVRSNKVSSNNFQTSCDLGEIRAGFGNPIAIQIPSNSAINLEIDLASLELEAKAMQVGSTLSYNQIAKKCAVIEAADGALTLTDTPVAMKGFNTPYVYVQEVGSTTFDPTAYTVSSTNQVEGLSVTNGTSYAVTYYIANASAVGYNITANFAPGIYHVTAQIGVFSNANTSNNSQSSQVGWLYYIIPRMQFSGNSNLDGGPTSNVVTSLTGTALSYDESNVGVCTDCAVSNLAYVYYVPIAGVTSAVSQLVVPGGVVTVAQGGTQQIPVLYLMPDGSTVQPNYGDLTYQIASGGDTYASVSPTGVISGTAQGDTEVTINLASPALSCVANVTVTAPAG